MKGSTVSTAIQIVAAGLAVNDILEPYSAMVVVIAGIVSVCLIYMEKK